MNAASLRRTLHQRIDEMPDFMLQRLATVTNILAAKDVNGSQYSTWSENEWQSFVLEQFFRDEEDDPVVYTLNDAQEVYNR